MHDIIHVEPETDQPRASNTEGSKEVLLVEEEPVSENTNPEQAQGKPRCILPMFYKVLFYYHVLRHVCALGARSCLTP